MTLRLIGMASEANRFVGWAIPRPIRSAIRDSLLQRHAQLFIPYWERPTTYLNGSAEPVRVGFVGSGTYARHHMKALSSMPGVELFAILTTGGPRVSEVAPLYGIRRIFSDPQEFLSQNEVDCYVVVVPGHRIKDVAKRCLNTGKPVLLEKPAGLSSQETMELVDAAESSGTFGMVGMNRRFYSVVEHGLAALATCGPIRGAVLEIPEAISKERRSGRLAEVEYDHWMFRNSVHGIDLLRFVMGDPVRVHSLARPNTEFNNASASFACVVEHGLGRVSTILGAWDTPPGFRLKVIAERGSVEFEPLERGWFTNEKGFRAPIKVDPTDLAFRMGVFFQDLRFIEGVKEGRKPSFPACLLPDAYKTNLFVEQILNGNLQSYSEGMFFATEATKKAENG